MKISKLLKRNPCKECAYYHKENNVCQSKKVITCGANPYVSLIDRMFCKPYSVPEREKGTDFPQAEDIEPTVESFKRTMDNIDKLMGDFDSFPEREKGTLIGDDDINNYYFCPYCGSRL